MNNPRKSAYFELAEAEKKVRDIPASVTVLTNEKIKEALLSIVRAQHRAVEWLDAIE
jgi:ribosomal protein L39E